MPRVTLVNKSRTDQGSCRRCGAEIKSGDSYFWFKNRVGRSSIRKVFCKDHRPRASEMTTSDKLGRLYEAQESVEDQIPAASSLEDLAQALREAAEIAREVGEEYRESLSNMPEQFQQGDQAQEMEEKADNCDCWADTLEQAADEIEAMEPDPDDDPEEDGGTTVLEHACTVASDAAGELSL